MAGDDGISEVRDAFAIVPEWLVVGASAEAVRLFAWLACHYAARGSGECFPSQHRLAVDLGVNERSVRRWLDELRELGAVEWKSGRPGRANVYRLWIRVGPPPRPRTLVSGTPDSGVRAARTLVSAQPEESLTRAKTRKETRTDEHEIAAIVGIPDARATLAGSRRRHPTNRRPEPET